MGPCVPEPYCLLSSRRNATEEARETIFCVNVHPNLQYGRQNNLNNHAFGTLDECFSKSICAILKYTQY